MTDILSVIRQCDFSLDGLADVYPELRILMGVEQNPVYHAEGDVYRHTRMVCQEMVKMEQWPALSEKEQEMLFLAGAFHDIGKPACTRLEDGRWTSPKHTIAGEKVFRAMAYRGQDRFGLTWRDREQAAGLIRYHGLPAWFWSKRRPEFDLLKAAESVPMGLLYLLSAADARGRICREPEKMREHIALFLEQVRELGIEDGPYPFAGAYTRYQYFHRDSLWQGSDLYDDTEFDVWLMAGLPLAGKDTWIEENGEGRPVISLDDIRQQQGIAPGEKSSKVAAIATDRARQFLRRKEPFIWNATNIIRETRQKLCGLFSSYKARVHIMYLEVPYRELLKRNEKRNRYIPVKVLEQMIDKLEVPAPWEGYDVRVSAGKDAQEPFSGRTNRRFHAE